MRYGSIVSIVVLCAAAGASAETRRVRSQYPTIQSAIQASVDGDVVVVEPGVYYETINFGGKDIVVTSTDPNDPKVVNYTVINADDDGSAVTFDNGETRAAVLTGFTITSGTGTVNSSIEGTGANNTFWGAGIYCLRSSPTITRNIISNNHAPFVPGDNMQAGQESYGGGIACIECGPVITHNIIRNNSALLGGGVTTYICDAVVGNNLIHGNSASLGGGVLFIGGSLYNNTIVANECPFGSGDAMGGNVYLVSHPMFETPRVFNNIICNARSGGGVCLQGALPLDHFVFNDVWGNVPGNYAVPDSQQAGVAHYDGPHDRTGTMGNISLDPVFQYPFGNDYHLTAESPCVNGADPDFVPPPAETDIDGDPRVHASRVDMGADEHVGYNKPVALAGPDQHVLTPFGAVILDGSRSYFNDPCGLTSFRWTQTQGAPVTLDDPNCATPTFVPDVEGRYVFELVAADDLYASEPDEVLVLVAENGAPVASAGVGKVWEAPGPVVLDGTGSYDPDGVDRLRYTWTQVDGPAVDLDDADTAAPSFSGALDERYAFELVVNDGFVDSAPSRVEHVTVGVTKDLEGRTIPGPSGDPAYYPDLDGTKVVFSTGIGLLQWQIACKDLRTGQSETFSGGSTNMQPKIDGDLVVWSGGATFENGYGPECMSVFVRNVTTGSQRALRTRSDVASFSHPAVSGDKVVWVRHLGIDKYVAEQWYDMPYDICGADVSDLQKPQYFTVATGVGRRDPFPLDDPAEDCDVVSICDDLVVWEGQGDIYAADLSDVNDIKAFTICDHPARQYDPVISGRFVVWTDERNDQGDIYGADISDLSSVTEYEIARMPGMQAQPAVDGPLIVYVDDDPYGSRAALACITRQHGILNTAVPDVQLCRMPALDGTTLVWLDGLSSMAEAVSLRFGYSMSDGPVLNAQTGTRHDYIQHAINCANAGDEIVVAEGRYGEKIDFVGKALTVRSTDPADPAIVAATAIDSGGDVVTFSLREDTNSVLDGLTVTGGDNGILCHGTTPTIRRCTVTANRGPGVTLLNESNPTISHCRITANAGPGIEMQAIRAGRITRYSQATVRNCVIAANRHEGLHSGRPTVINCTIVENLRAGIAGSARTVTNSIVYFNNANGVQIDSSYAAVTYSDVQGGWPGDGNIDADPLFVTSGSWSGDAEPPTAGAAWIAGDYHLRSQGWRWDSEGRSWVSDAVTSPCIDGGDPSSAIFEELAVAPQGQGANVRINMGAYGGTAEASLAPLAD